MWEPLDSMAPRATWRVYAPGPTDKVIDMAVNPSFAVLALEAVLGPAVVVRPTADTADCKY